MAHDRLTMLRLGGLEHQPHTNALGARPAQAELLREVATQRVRDEQQGLAVFDRLLELSMRAGEKRRTPRRELVGLETSCEQDRVPSVAAELALQLAWTDRRHRAKCAK